VEMRGKMKMLDFGEFRRHGAFSVIFNRVPRTMHNVLVCAAPNASS
jgi:hypothetical protein